MISTLRFLPNALAYFWIVDKHMASAWFFNLELPTS
jgi:hypothetical protein